MNSPPSGYTLSTLLVLLDGDSHHLLFSPITTDEPDTIEGPVTDQEPWEWVRAEGIRNTRHSSVVSPCDFGKSLLLSSRVHLEIRSHALACRLA